MNYVESAKELLAKWKAQEAESCGNLTPRAKQVIALAYKEAERLNHKSIGTGHVLLGLIKLGLGVAINVLKNLGLNLENVRMEVEKQVGIQPDQKITGPILFTPRTKRVLETAKNEATLLNRTYVGTEHLLLGLLRESEGVAARVLKNFNVNIEQTRREILNELDPHFLSGDDEQKKSS